MRNEKKKHYTYIIYFILYIIYLLYLYIEWEGRVWGSVRAMMRNKNILLILYISYYILYIYHIYILRERAGSWEVWEQWCGIKNILFILYISYYILYIERGPGLGKCESNDAEWIAPRRPRSLNGNCFLHWFYQDSSKKQWFFWLWHADVSK